MLVCSFFAPIYYAFSCNPYSRYLYLTSISLLGILVIITLIAPALSTPRFRSFRASLFLAMGFSGVIPAAHVVVLFWGHPQMVLALRYELVMGVLYAVEASFYMSRIPERWKPGAFDIAGHSHQIFHAFVVSGALTPGIGVFPSEVLVSPKGEDEPLAYAELVLDTFDFFSKLSKPLCHSHRHKYYGDQRYYSDGAIERSWDGIDGCGKGSRRALMEL
ncbi:hypothetical protein ACSBR1_017983 [Camellia fascicularis]